jgi:hypothetical protein
VNLESTPEGDLGEVRPHSGPSAEQAAFEVALRAVAKSVAERCIQIALQRPDSKYRAYKYPNEIAAEIRAEFISVIR